MGKGKRDSVTVKVAFYIVFFSIVDVKEQSKLKSCTSRAKALEGQQEVNTYEFGRC